MNHFTPWASLAGGMLIGLAASLLLLAAGRTAGVSGIVGSLLLRAPGDRVWRALFLAGLVVAGALFSGLAPAVFGGSPQSLPVLGVAGLLVGVGTSLGSGCTSGHGVCGISRLSPRSLLATCTFVAVGMLTVSLLRWLGGGS